MIEIEMNEELEELTKDRQKLKYVDSEIKKIFRANFERIYFDSLNELMDEEDLNENTVRIFSKHFDKVKNKV